MPACEHCASEFTPKPRRNRHGVIGEQSARYCSDRCRLRAHRSRSAQNARQRLSEARQSDETALDGGMYPPAQKRRETALETPVLQGAKPAPKLPEGIVRDGKYPNMYRLVLPDGSLSDMLNLTRARDALRALSDKALLNSSKNP